MCLPAQLCAHSRPHQQYAKLHVADAARVAISGLWVFALLHSVTVFTTQAHASQKAAAIIMIHDHDHDTVILWHSMA
jgi:xanthine/CO dehydrogenase XdhC/CoxF family maturation factor